MSEGPDATERPTSPDGARRDDRSTASSRSSQAISSSERNVRKLYAAWPRTAWYHPAPMQDRGGIGWALLAIVIWATLTAATGDALAGVPAATLLFFALAFSAPLLVGLDLARGRTPRAVLAARPRLYLLGVLGIFGYHALLFLALERAPIVEANLLNYLWPLFMVLLAPLLAGERLAAATLVGAFAGLAGAAIVVTQGRALDLSPAHVWGYGLAATAAVLWAVFSVLLRRLGPEAEGRMPLFVTASLLPAAALVLAQGGLVPPRGRALFAVAWLGLGPMGIAFVFWSRAVARGSAARIGALSYLTPLLSTLCVSFTLGKPITGATWVGMALIVGGSALGARPWRAAAPRGRVTRA